MCIILCTEIQKGNCNHGSLVPLSSRLCVVDHGHLSKYVVEGVTPMQQIMSFDFEPWLCLQMCLGTCNVKAAGYVCKCVKGHVMSMQQAMSCKTWPSQ